MNPAVLNLANIEQTFNQASSSAASTSANLSSTNNVNDVNDVEMEEVHNVTVEDEPMEEAGAQQTEQEEVEEVLESVRQSRRVCNACGSSTHQRSSSRACPHNRNSIRMAARDPTRVPTVRDDRGEMNIICGNVKCAAKMWIHERISTSSLSNPQFQMCCSKGSANIDHLKRTPPIIASLLTGSDEKSKEFRSNIRLYNSSLSFSSMGVKLDQSLANMRSGNYTFRIQGSPYHMIGSALPQDGANPAFAQIYIYDSE